jgi:hypothetical protein
MRAEAMPAAIGKHCTNILKQKCFLDIQHGLFMNGRVSTSFTMIDKRCLLAH